MQDSFKLYIGYIVAMLTLLIGAFREFYNRNESRAKVKKIEIENSEALMVSYKETATDWRVRYEDQKHANAELIKSNKVLVENILKEQQDKTSYIEEIHKLRIEVAELRNIIVKFQAQFPDLFKPSDKK